LIPPLNKATSWGGFYFTHTAKIFNGEKKEVPRNLKKTKKKIRKLGPKLVWPDTVAHVCNPN
jgi:hypothetical protein